LTSSVAENVPTFAREFVWTDMTPGFTALTMLTNE
jgi:hypothetical protein